MRRSPSKVGVPRAASILFGIGGVVAGDVSGGAVSVSDLDAGRLSSRRWPHSLQNLALGGLRCPQLGQGAGSFAPHSLQNLASSGFEVWQLEQIIFFQGGPVHDPIPFNRSPLSVHRNCRALRLLGSPWARVRGPMGSRALSRSGCNAPLSLRSTDYTQPGNNVNRSRQSRP